MTKLNKIKLIFLTTLLASSLGACTFRQSTSFSNAPSQLIFNTVEPQSINNIFQQSGVTFEIEDETIATLTGVTGGFQEVVPLFNGTTQLMVKWNQEELRLPIIVNTRDFEHSVGLPNLQTPNLNIEGDSNSGYEALYQGNGIFVRHNGQVVGILSSPTEESRFKLDRPGIYQFSYKNIDGDSQILSTQTVATPKISYIPSTQELQLDKNLSSLQIFLNNESIQPSLTHKVKTIGENTVTFNFQNYFNEIIELDSFSFEVEPNFQRNYNSEINRPIKLKLLNDPVSISIEGQPVQLNRNQELSIRRMGSQELVIKGLNGTRYTYQYNYTNQFYENIMTQNIYWFSVLGIVVLTLVVKVPKVIKR